MHQCRSRRYTGGPESAHVWGKTDLHPPVILSRRYVRFDTHLSESPMLPPAVLDLYNTWHGRGTKVVEDPAVLRAFAHSL